MLNSWLNVQSCLNYRSLPNVTFIHSAKRKFYVKSNSICSWYRYTDVCVYVCMLLWLLEAVRKTWLLLIQMFRSTCTYLTASLDRESMQPCRKTDSVQKILDVLLELYVHILKCHCYSFCAIGYWFLSKRLCCVFPFCFLEMDGAIISTVTAVIPTVRLSL